MAQRKLKKDFDKEKMYSKIMPTYARRPETRGEPEPDRPAAPLLESPEDAYVLRNFMEDIVCERVERTIDMLRGCHCERCRKDVMAIALAEMPAVYEVVERGEVEALIEQVRIDYEVKVSAALIKAVQAVKSSPNHAGQEGEVSGHGG